LSLTLTTQLNIDTLEAKNFSQLRDLCYKFFETQNVSRLSYHHSPPLGAEEFHPHLTIVALGFPKGSVKRWSETRMYERDPIFRHVASSTRAFWWSEIGSLTPLAPAEKRYMKEVSVLGIGDGLAIPVFGPHGRNGYFGIGFGDPRPELDIDQISLLQWSCQIMHLRYCDLLAAILPKEIRISVQEKSVLRHIARGKTNTQISKELNVTSKTIATYVARSFEKLDASDRMTAALRALALGLLD
jgi:LuxR family transcriptional regulator, quorum-sensing system regulator CciR